MVERIVARRLCLDDLRIAGVRIESPLVGMLVGRGITQSNLDECVRFAKIIGPHSFQSFLFNAQNAAVFSKKPLSDKQKTIALIKAFSPAFKKLFNDSSLKSAGNLRIVNGSNPFKFAIELVAPLKRPAPYFSFSFNLRIKPNGKSEAIIGNFHVLNPEIALKYQTKVLNERVIDLFLRRFSNNFEMANTRVLASNTRSHKVYQNPQIDAIIAKLRFKGKITEAEAIDYVCSRAYIDLQLENKQITRSQYRERISRKEESSKLAPKVDALVRDEIKRIRSIGIVSHKIAFKKAGFRVKKKGPYWRLDPRRKGGR